MKLLNLHGTPCIWYVFLLSRHSRTRRLDQQVNRDLYMRDTRRRLRRAGRASIIASVSRATKPKGNKGPSRKFKATLHIKYSISLGFLFVFSLFKLFLFFILYSLKFKTCTPPLTHMSFFHLQNDSLCLILIRIHRLGRKSWLPY